MGQGQPPCTVRKPRSGVMGNSWTRAPMASRTALAMAAAVGVSEGSPTPFAPKGPSPLPDSIRTVRMSGQPIAAGRVDGLAGWRVKFSQEADGLAGPRGRPHHLRDGPAAHGVLAHVHLAVSDVEDLRRGLKHLGGLLEEGAAQLP